ncbi:MAG: type II toxin-antitoxin system VapC family toxin [Methylococcales bacterium]|nr:type II toxin-antitoxin system VapC family toxin [Methylococcales bacterium]
MRYLLDTNICIAFFKNHPTVIEKIRTIGIENLLLCSPVKAELWYGACKSERTTANKIILQEFFTQFSSLAFNDEVIEQYGEIRAFLAKSGNIIGANDLLIAAIATTHQTTLVTHNVREFKRVPNLIIDDWLA